MARPLDRPAGLGGGGEGESRDIDFEVCGRGSGSRGLAAALRGIRPGGHNGGRGRLKSLAKDR